MDAERDAGRRAIGDAAVTSVASVVLMLSLVARTGVPWTWGLAAIVSGLVIPVLASVSVIRRQPRISTAADRVTLLRGVMGGGCATLVALSLMGEWPLRSWPLFILALLAYLLDGVDGWVARRMGNASAAGGRLDMETDAAFLIVLSVALAPIVGLWVLGIGAMRYLFWLAALWRPALRQTLEFSHFRRTVAGIQGGVLVGALLPVIPDVVAAPAVALALALLMVSFGKDTVTLERSFSRHVADAPTVASPRLVTPPR